MMTEDNKLINSEINNDIKKSLLSCIICYEYSENFTTCINQECMFQCCYNCSKIIKSCGYCNSNMNITNIIRNSLCQYDSCNGFCLECNRIYKNRETLCGTTVVLK